MLVKGFDKTGRATFQEVGDPFLVAFGKAYTYYMTWMWRAWRGAVFEYRKARKKSLPFHARIPADDPLISRVDDDATANPLETIPQDEPQYVVYRTEGGIYFTETMLSNPRWGAILAPKVAGSRITQAVDISDERAYELVEQLDALEMDAELTDNEKSLRQACRAQLAGIHAR